MVFGEVMISHSEEVSLIFREKISLLFFLSTKSGKFIYTSIGWKYSEPRSRTYISPSYISHRVLDTFSRIQQMQQYNYAHCFTSSADSLHIQRSQSPPHDPIIRFSSRQRIRMQNQTEFVASSTKCCFSDGVSPKILSLAFSAIFCQLLKNAMTARSKNCNTEPQAMPSQSPLPSILKPKPRSRATGMPTR